MTPLISILHATRGRPKMAVETMRQYRDRSKLQHPTEYIFSFDRDDATSHELVDLVIAEPRVPWFSVHMLSGYPPASNAAWNRAWACSVGDLLLASSDDFEPPPEWDAQLADAIGGLIPGMRLRPMVVGVSDIHGGWEAPLTGDGAAEYYICSKAYTEVAGYFLYPEYLTFGVFDIDQKAILDDCLVPAYHVRFLHHWHGGESDPLRDNTYRRAHLYADPKFANVAHKQLDEDRKQCGYLDVRLDADPHRMFNRGEFIAPPCVPFLEQCEMFHRRIEAGWGRLRNVLPWNPEDPRCAYHRGDYRAALDGFLRLRDRYAPLCEGRMRHHGLKHVIAVCEEQLRGA